MNIGVGNHIWLFGMFSSGRSSFRCYILSSDHADCAVCSKGFPELKKLRFVFSKVEQTFDRGRFCCYEHALQNALAL